MARKKTGNPEGMTDKQKLFCDEYLVDLNGAQAAIRAGYSDKAAKEQASRLLTKANIQVYMQAAMEKRSKATGITSEYVLNGIRDVITDATSTISDLEGNMGMMDRPAALKGYELLGKHLKMWTDKVEVEMPTVRIKDFTGENA